MPRQLARERGKRVVGTKWVDVNKGGDVQPNPRYRLVAKDLGAPNPYTPQEELYAVTPPTGAQNLLLSRLRTRRSRRRPPYKLCFLDVRRAVFYAEAIDGSLSKSRRKSGSPERTLSACWGGTCGAWGSGKRTPHLASTGTRSRARGW